MKGTGSGSCPLCWRQRQRPALSSPSASRRNPGKPAPPGESCPPSSAPTEPPQQRDRQQRHQGGGHHGAVQQPGVNSRQNAWEWCPGSSLARRCWPVPKPVSIPCRTQMSTFISSGIFGCHQGSSSMPPAPEETKRSSNSQLVNEQLEPPAPPPPSAPRVTATAPCISGISASDHFLRGMQFTSWLCVSCFSSRRT